MSIVIAAHPVAGEDGKIAVGNTYLADYVFVVSTYTYYGSNTSVCEVVICHNQFCILAEIKRCQEVQPRASNIVLVAALPDGGMLPYWRYAGYVDGLYMAVPVTEAAGDAAVMATEDLRQARLDAETALTSHTIHRMTEIERSCYGL